MDQTKPGKFRTRVRRALGVLRGVDSEVTLEAHNRLRRFVKKHQRSIDELSQQVTALEAPASGHGDDALRKEVSALQSRVRELEADLFEQRGLAVRVAELADVVAHLLGSAAREDKDEFRRALAEYADGL